MILSEMVDDPSAHPDIFPTAKTQEKERYGPMAQRWGAQGPAEFRSQVEDSVGVSFSQRS